MPTKILVPTDASPESSRALPVAQVLALALEAEGGLVQVVPYPVIVDDFEGYSAQLWQQIFDASKANAEANLAAVAGQFEAAGLKVSRIEIEGSPAAGLLDVEKE